MVAGFAVTTTMDAWAAIEMLRKNKNGFDIVITDVMRSDLDGFKLSEIISLEMDIPVIRKSLMHLHPSYIYIYKLI